ncbi:hypothetical protein [Hyella patelloides]|uniref:hypothetical protein n=1 Tax=Hyella patelloides TaxID=1982969 RepID=UPI0011A25721|nr:hypothetical protein [Hyella patelloides]
MDRLFVIDHKIAAIIKANSVKLPPVGKEVGSKTAIPAVRVNTSGKVALTTQRQGLEWDVGKFF